MCLTWYEWSCIASGHILRETKEWQRARYIAWMVYSMNASKKMTPHELMPLVTDPLPEKPKQITEEEKEQMRQKAIQRANAFANKGA